MAYSREQVYSLFGASPALIMQQEAQRQAEAARAIQNPYSQMGFTLGSALGRAFGGESAEVTQARQMQEALQGIDPNDPKALRSVARVVAQFDPSRAMTINAYANELEKSQRPKTEYKEVTIGYTEKPILGLGGIPTGETQQVAIKDTAILENGVITGYTSGRDPKTMQLTSADSSAKAGVDTTSRFLWSREKGRYPNPNYQAPSGDQVGQGTVLKEGASAVFPSANVEANRNVQAEEAALGRGARATVAQPKEILNMTTEPGTADRRRSLTGTPEPVSKAEMQREGLVGLGGIDAISDDALMARYRALKKKGAKRTSKEDGLLKRLESQLMSRGLTGAL